MYTYSILDINYLKFVKSFCYSNLSSRIFVVIG